MSALWSWFKALLIVLGLAAPAGPTSYQGYVEGEFVLVAPVVGGTLQTLAVRRGDHVAKGASLFGLDAVEETASRDQAHAMLQQARDRMANLEKGRRRPEIDVIAAQRVQAEKQLHLAKIELDRQERLLATGDTPKAVFDQAETSYQQDMARIDELDAQVAVAHMPQGREDELRAAQGDVNASNAALVQAQWRLDQKTVAAPSSGLVADTYFNPGELVAAGQPIVEILPPGNIKARFFIPQDALARFPIGTAVSIRCDRCAEAIPATVRFVAPNAEYTPPVLYNRENRAKLVFMVEAWPNQRPDVLRPGQPVDVLPISP